MTNSTMQAVRVYSYGGPEQLKLEQVPRPEAGEGEVLLRIHAVGVVPADWKIREGMFQSFYTPQFPYIPGSILAGTVEAVGPGVTAFKPGDAVFGQSEHGAYAEYATSKVSTLALKPEALSFDEGATIAGGATTAWQALFERGQLQAGQSVLIHGAAGGVGLFAVQFAHWKGARVYATASTSNIDFVRSLGADEVIDYTTTPFEQVVRDLDLVFDTIGGDTLERSFDTLKRGGQLISINAEPSSEKASARGIQAGFFSGNTTSANLSEIASLIAEGHVRAFAGRVFPLAEVHAAHELSQHGHGRARIVLHP
ncbi:NADP-dependent oxidoreductase [Ktedonospora formicarum]|uniref:NADPH:quinone reductase n=1 Tax=Ktedonospora formicarum TaxID=2778364 RepID=A0A8J3I9Q9_9CHLR|nr:NADP-dependent oxidoreductase [Ktedonospora formicarum]GHO48079.1 NADPH:quinone reductase [Ktedonospora formicarum]